MASGDQPIDLTDPVDADHAGRIGRAWIELRRGAWTQELRCYLVGHDQPLEPGQMDALDLLEREDRTMKQLAERMRIDPSSATRAVHRLVTDGLAVRAPAPDDGRVVMVQISEQGRTRHAEVAARRAHAMSLILGEFTAEERSDLADLLDRFVQSLDATVDRLSP
ncbi:MarR family winged helix-turn-helix transcriptional regulator [Ilumatobacter nonamiensis]|uniref:MarR family winged helix-turn-helix transcriptional regulator n=1 Tax=Ilumatobacter nonamiensis TaxID=467093 RepID=UPI0003468D1C|nr:MarR family transcriptional regulator [Ilumatobacter nonamiensis]